MALFIISAIIWCGMICAVLGSSAYIVNQADNDPFVRV